MAKVIIEIWDEDGNQWPWFNKRLKFCEVMEDQGTDEQQIHRLLFDRLNVKKPGQLSIPHSDRFCDIIGWFIPVRDRGASRDEFPSGLMSDSKPN
jgi:hypothetical protein